MLDLSFYRGKRVLITGHTGFKGSWMCHVLLLAGAEVTGYALPAPTTPSLFALSGVKAGIHSITGDVRDMAHLSRVFDEYAPEIVLHMAAQPLVRAGYEEPVYTYETNVMGTVNLLECVRGHSCVRSLVNVTTDKVYENREWAWGYRENEPLDGFDPYSNSKSCSELVTHCYTSSFLAGRGVAVSTARAGNVIGGGDFAADRIIPDCVRAAENSSVLKLRHPHSVRPYQHVLEPVCAYLMLAQRQYVDRNLAGWYNIGPDECDCVTTGALADMFCDAWQNGLSWESEAQPDAPHEANYLKLDCSRLKSVFGWQPRWHIREAVEKTVEWTRAYFGGGDIPAVMDGQIRLFLEA